MTMTMRGQYVELVEMDLKWSPIQTIASWNISSVLIQIQQLSGAAVENVHVNLPLLDGHQILPLQLHGLHLHKYYYI